MTVRYETKRNDDYDLHECMKVLVYERRRFGYRRLHVLLKYEGHVINHKKLFRIYREEKLTVRKHGGKRAIEYKSADGKLDSGKSSLVIGLCVCPIH